MKTKKKFLLFAAVLGVSILGTGCGQKTEEEKEPELKYATVGEESEDAYDILLTNATGNVITGLAVKSSSQTGYPANMMSTDQKIEADETVQFFYTSEYEGGINDVSSSEDSDASDSDTGSDTSEEETAPIANAAINETYSLQVTFEDGTVKELTTFAVDDMKEADLMYEDEVAFVKYTSVSEEVEINTKETELAVKANKDAAQAVNDQIQAIGEVTLESESAITAARTAYDALTEEQKQYVTNAQLLTDQENTLASLKQAEAEAAAAAQAQAEAEAAAQAAADAAAAQSWSDQSSGYTDYGYSDPGYSSSGGTSSGVDQSSGSCLGDVVINN